MSLRIKSYKSWKMTKWPWFFFFPPEPQTTRKQSITEQKHRDNASSIYVPFPHKRKKEAEKTFCAGHESAEKWIHVDIFHSGTRYPECASSIHTTFPQDPVGACQQILCFYMYSIQAVWLGHEARLLQSDRDFFERGSYAAPCLLFHFSKCLL